MICCIPKWLKSMKTLKAIVEVAKAATEEKKPVAFKDDTNNSMYG